MGTTHLTALEIIETLTVTGASTLTGNVAIAGTLATTGAYTPTGGIALGTDKAIQFRDSAIKIYSPADGELDLIADGKVRVPDDVPLQLGDDNNYIKHDTGNNELVISSDEAIVLESTVGHSVTAPTSGGEVDETADGTIHDKRLCIIDGSGDLVEADTDSVNVVGINDEGSDVSSTDAIALGLSGHFTGVADALIEGGTHLKSCSGGRVGRFITTTLAGTTMKTAAAGTAFTNQPANDGIEVLSDSAADTSLNVTIYGTTNGADTLVKEVVVTDASDGTTPVASTKVDWGLILGVEADAHAGTLTIREASADQAITTLATGTNSSGVETVTATRAFNKAPTIVSDAGTTKQIGLVGTSTAYAELLDSQALNGATAVTMNSAFNGVTKLLVGDLEAARACTLAVGAADDYQLLVGKAGPAGAAAKDADVIVII